MRFDTYDPTGAYIIDSSAEASFDDLLTPTVASIDLDSLLLTDNEIGQLTDFSFNLLLDGFVRVGDTMKIQIDPIPMVDYSG